MTPRSCEFGHHPRRHGEGGVEEEYLEGTADNGQNINGDERRKRTRKIESGRPDDQPRACCRQKWRPGISHVRGEILAFPDTELPPGDAAAVAGEESVRKIWDRRAEDVAWRDM